MSITVSFLDFYIFCAHLVLQVGQKTVLISSFNVTHLRLTEHLETVLTDELQQLAVGEAEELIFLSHLRQREYAHLSPFADFIFLCGYVFKYYPVNNVSR